MDAGAFPILGFGLALDSGQGSTGLNFWGDSLDNNLSRFSIWITPEKWLWIAAFAQF
jgi:hypothetical protein